MANQSKIALPGYMSPVGYSRKLTWSGDVFGSNNYQAGGYVSAASDYGMVGMESYGLSFGGINISGAAQGTYIMKAKPPANIASNSEQMAPTFAQVTLQWYYAANNAEVANGVDLSAQAVRTDIRGV